MSRARLLWLLVAMCAVCSALNWARLSFIEQGRLLERAEARDQADELVRKASAAGQRLAGDAKKEADEAREFASQLQRETRRDGVQLSVVACRSTGGVRVDLDRGAVGVAAGGAGLRLPTAAAAAGELAGLRAEPMAAGGGAAESVLLTAGAVSLWNSALAGTGVPSGACGAADPTAGACAVATSLALPDAWDNHIENAARCRQDRARHQRLIEYVRGLQAPREEPTATAP